MIELGFIIAVLVAVLWHMWLKYPIIVNDAFREFFKPIAWVWSGLKMYLNWMRCYRG